MGPNDEVDEAAAGRDEEVALSLVRQLKVNAQLQQAWSTQLFQTGQVLHPAAAWLLAELGRVGECRPSELAKRRMVDVSVISRQLAQLTASGLVERRPAPEDGRAALIRVSEEGNRELARWRKRYIDFVCDALGDWDPDEISGLATRLEEANDLMRAAMDRYQRGS